MSSQTKPLTETINNWARTSVAFKLLSIGILVLVLLLPASMIRDLVREREYRLDEAIVEVSSKWGNEQIITAPVLTVPYLEEYEVIENYQGIESRVTKTRRQLANYLPESLVISGSLTPEMRYRGIYEIAVYNSQLHFSGNFPPLPALHDEMLWDEAFLSLSISDIHGIKDNIDLTWGNASFPLEPGIKSDVLYSGVSTPLQVNPALSQTFAFDLDLNGSQAIRFTPLGKETTVHLDSTWSTPSFNGSFLPDSHEISDSGFTADWQIFNLNRDFPQAWDASEKYKLEGSSFGVDLFVPVDEYQKTMRSVKYAIMMISLTFLVFFFVEILNHKRIHAIQYLLVGLALCIFYLLLLSLSEHIGFDRAYLSAGAATTILITLYARSIFHSSRLTISLGLILIILYGFIFTILQLQDFALLMGSLGLFIVMAIVMFLFRKIDWYSFSESK